MSDSLHTWFSRNNGKGWIDCKRSTKKKLVPCGRKAATGGKYPACRPVKSQCNGSSRKKKGHARISWKTKKANK